MTFRIARLQSSDRPRWSELWSAYQAFYRTDIPAAVTESTWQRLTAGRVHGFGAHDGGATLVGIVHFLYHEDTWSLTPTCYLQDLFVATPARGGGCARQLIEAVAGAAHAAGAGPPYWLTHESNVTARQLYDRLGHNAGFIQYLYTPVLPPLSS